jgi:hypothetical protein
MSTATTFGDSCLGSAEGYSISLGFWWHIAFPDKVIQRMLIHIKDSSNGLLNSINVLKFIMVIINYCASLHIITRTKITDTLIPYSSILPITHPPSRPVP